MAFQTGPLAPSTDAAIEETEAFFKPALKDRDDNNYISHKLVGADFIAESTHLQLLNRAGSLLLQIHTAVIYDKSSEQSFDSSLLLAIYKLLDFIALEGIYPSLSPGLSTLADRRNKSLFYKHGDASYRALKVKDQLEHVLNSILKPVLEDVGIGIEPIVRHRILIDVILAVVWAQHSKIQIDKHFYDLYFSQLPVATLYTAYTSILRQIPQEEVRSIIAEQLSLLPLRQGGIRSTIEFLAASHNTSSRTSADDIQPSQGPVIPLEALQQTSKLLSSIPRSMSAEAYFSQVAPQLWSLLDERSESALQTAAAFIIGNGILGKRNIGAPGTIGWRLFAAPLLDAINPAPSVGPIDPDASWFITPEDVLRSSLTRLSTLITSHPNPGLTGRLLKPLLLPLWAIANYKGMSFASTECSNMAFALMTRFYSLVGTTKDWIHLYENIPWNGPKWWVIGANDSAGIAIQHRNVQQDLDFDRVLAEADGRVQAFCCLMTSSKLGSSVVSSLFDHLARQQLLSETKNIPTDDETMQVITNLSKVKLLQALADRFLDHLTSSFDQIAGLIQQVLFKHLDDLRAAQQYRTRDMKPSLKSLADLTQDDRVQENTSTTTADTDVLVIALSLLNALVTSVEAKQEPGSIYQLGDMQRTLQQLEKLHQDDEALLLQIRTTQALIESQVNKTSAKAKGFDLDGNDDVQSTLNLIMIDITSDLPPVRRSAVHALQALIKSPTSPLDVPPLALLLLDLVRHEKEEFVYLAAIQATHQLALRRNLGFVVRQFTEAFQDAEEQTGVDGRLRIGEALAGLADELGEADLRGMKCGEVLRGVADTMLNVAARRGQRKGEQLERHREERLRKRKQRDAERAWGGEVPDVPEDATIQDADFVALSPLQQARRLQDLQAIESIVKGWEDTGPEEDIRIRASALSILGRLHDTCAADMSSNNEDTTLINSTINISLSILSLELDPAKAILRRSAALAVFSILRGVDAQLEGSTEEKARVLRSTVLREIMDGKTWNDAATVLKWVVDTEYDDLTVGHAEAALEGLEAVRMKAIAGVAENAQSSQVLGVDGKLKGLDLDVETLAEESADVGSATKAQRPKIEEIE